MLVRLRMSAKRIKRAVLEVDDDALSVDDLEALSRLLPSPEEAERLKAFEGDETKLAKPDQYFREVSLLVHGLPVVHATCDTSRRQGVADNQISTIPNLKARFEAMVFRRKFDMLLGEIMPDLGIIRSAVLEVRESERFKDVLGVVLTLGNALNVGTFRGNAAGFQLEALAKVSSHPTVTACTLER